ncbi:MAG: hypothetical protein KA198_04420 [Chitinophagaceae bacterium]|nr:hypothetical protein [Chitinophagaceae bacterium]
MKNYLLCCIALFFSVQSFSQYDHLKFKHYSTENGLSQASIYQIYQDKKGFIWLATWDGLNRFDGYQFTVFKPNLNNKHSIRGSRISSMVEDDSGHLWVGTYEALNKYDPSTNQFTPYYVEGATGKFETRYNPFFIDESKELWFTYNTENLGSMNIVTGKVTLYHFADGHMKHCAIVEKKLNTSKQSVEIIYTSGRNGLNKIDLKGRKVTHYFSENKVNHYGSKKFIWQVVDDGYSLWLATQDDLYSMNKLTQQFMCYPYEQNMYAAKALTSLAIDSKGMLWCATEGNGLWIFDLKQQKFKKRYINNTSDPHSLANNILNSVFADKEDNIWVNTDPYGIDKVNPYQQFFGLLTNTESVGKINSNTIWSMCAFDKSKVILCFNQSGPMLYDFISGARSVYQLPQSYKNTSIYHIAKDQDGQIWMATDNGLYTTKDTFKHLQQVDAYKKFNVTILEHANSILFGTEEGVSLFKKHGESVNKVSIAALSNLKVSTMAANSLNNLFVATVDKELIITDASYKELSRHRLPFIIKCMLPKANETLWLGTNMGLVKYNLTNHSYRIFTESEGLANQYIYGIQEDRFNRLWLSSNKGISLFNLSNYEITNFDIAQGLQGWEFNTRSFCTLPNGTMLFGGVSGANYFMPSQYKQINFEANVELISADINNKTVPLNLIQDSSNPYRCKFDQNNISLEFVAIDFMKSNTIQYFYKLKKDATWVSLGNKRTLQLVNMKPDKYEICIQGRLSNKEVSSTMRTIYIEVEAPFYQRTWFYICGVLFIGFIAYSIFYYKLQGIKRVEQLRNKLSRDLHDDMGGTLSSINMLSRTSSNMNPEKAKLALEKINLRSQKLLGKMSDIIWNINPYHDGLEEMITRMRNYAALMLETAGIEYQIFFPEEKIEDKISLDKKSNTYLIFKEAINNLCKYSHATMAVLELRYHDKKIFIRVEDNGIGFDSKLLTHVGGLETMKQRAKEMKAKITIESNIDKGTCIKLSVL